MKSIRVILFFLACMAGFQNLLAQDSLYTVQLTLEEGNENVILSNSWAQKVDNCAGFQYPVDANSCYTGYFRLKVFFVEVIENRNQSDSARKKFEEFMSIVPVDTMQFVGKKLLCPNIYFCIWIDNNIKNIVFDTDCDSSFKNEKVFSYDLRKGLYAGFDRNIEYGVSNIYLPYDSMDIRIQKRVPIRIALNSSAVMSGGRLPELENDSFSVYICPDQYMKGRLESAYDTVDLYAEVECFDQYYSEKNLLIKHVYSLNNEIKTGIGLEIEGRIYEIEKYDYLTRKLTIKYQGQIPVGELPGDFFAITPGLENFNNKYTLVYFTASWCGPCKKSTPLLKEFHKNNPQYEFYSVISEQSRDAFDKYVHNNAIEWSVIFDDMQLKESRYSEYYFVDYIPTLFLINPDRIILAKKVGPPDIEQLLKDLKEHGPEYLEIPQQK